MIETNTNADVEGSASELAVESVVVSLSAIAETMARSDGVRRLTVPRKAIVTPAVRDFLKQRNIELAFRNDGVAKSATAGKPEIGLRLIVGIVGANESQAESLLRLLARGPISVERIAAKDLPAMIDELARSLAGPSAIGLLLTSDAAAAVCLANRLAGVRAMAAGTETLTALSASARAIGANLLIIDPVGRSPFAIKPWIDRFCAGAPRACPPQWRGRLD